MRDYARVLPAFWTGQTGRRIRALGLEAQVVAMYLITSPHANMIGLYQLPIAYLANDTGIPFEGASKALQSLSEVGFCQYDDELEHVWVPEMARIQIGETLAANDNRHKALIREASRFSKSRFFFDFVEKYRDAFALPFKVEQSPFEAPSKPLRSQEQEQEQDQEQEQEEDMSATGSPQSPAEPAPADPVRLVFEAWLEEHVEPSHRGRCKLDGKRKRLIKARLKEYSPERLIAAIRGVKLSGFHMGDNHDGRKYNGLQTILRDAEQVEKFEALLANPPAPRPANRNARGPARPATHEEFAASWDPARDDVDLIDWGTPKEAANA